MGFRTREGETLASLRALFCVPQRILQTRAIVFTALEYSFSIFYSDLRTVKKIVQFAWFYFIFAMLVYLFDIH